MNRQLDQTKKYRRGIETRVLPISSRTLWAMSYEAVTGKCILHVIFFLLHPFLRGAKSLASGKGTRRGKSTGHRQLAYSLVSKQYFRAEVRYNFCPLSTSAKGLHRWLATVWAVGVGAAQMIISLSSRRPRSSTDKLSAVCHHSHFKVSMERSISRLKGHFRSLCHDFFLLSCVKIFELYLTFWTSSSHLLI